MGEETTRLRDEIDRTREDLTRDVDMLADRTSPSRIVERRVQRTRQGIGRGLAGIKEKVMGTPEGGGRHRAAYARESTVEAAGHMGQTARGTVTQAREHAVHAGERAHETAHDTVAGVREQTEGNPFAAGLVAFGVGWLVSSLMPATEAEKAAAQRAGEVAREHGRPVVEQAKQVAQEVGQELQGHAQEAAAQIKERTQEAAGTVKEEARSSTQG